MNGIVFEGTVVDGDHLGRTIGFPTANLQTAKDMEIPAGVFACRVVLPSGTVCQAMMNVGYRPTVNLGKDLRVEVHLLGFDGDLYGQTLRVEIVDFVRGEQKFDGIEALRAQLCRDRLAVQKRLKMKNHTSKKA